MQISAVLKILLLEEEQCCETDGEEPDLHFAGTSPVDVCMLLRLLANTASSRSVCVGDASFCSVAFHLATVAEAISK
jgi:hypothetical protein